MINKILFAFIFLSLASCGTVKDKMPERKACTGDNKTLADVFCKGKK